MFVAKVVLACTKCTSKENLAEGKSYVEPWLYALLRVRHRGHSNNNKTPIYLVDRLHMARYASCLFMYRRKCVTINMTRAISAGSATLSRPRRGGRVISLARERESCPIWSLEWMVAVLTTSFFTSVWVHYSRLDWTWHDQNFYPLLP
jgi:hypothetical protein